MAAQSEDGAIGTGSAVVVFARFLARFVAASRPFWASSWRYTGGLAALVVLTGAQVELQLRLNAWAARLYNALEARRLDLFLAQIGTFLLLMLLTMAVFVTHLRIKRVIQFAWRVWLSKALLDGWMASGRQYQLGFVPGPHDNPDGRIAEDVKIATETAIDLGLSLLYCSMLLVGFAAVLWRLSGIVMLPLGGVSLPVPGHLVFIALSYALATSALALGVGQPMVRASDLRQSLEADFRFGLGHARAAAEGIALIRGESDERARLLRLLRRVRDGWRGQTEQLTRIMLFTSAYGVLASPLPILLAAPRYILGMISLGTLMQTAQAFTQMTSALSWPVDNLAAVAQWRASAERVLALQESLARLDAAMAPTAPGCITLDPDGPHLRLGDVVLRAPDGAVLSLPVSADVTPGGNLLVCGDPPLARKLLLAMAGLWRWGDGGIHLPGAARIMFAAERPFLPPGNLGAAICYPSTLGVCLPAAVHDALHQVGLAALAPRLSEEANWAQTLSLPQQQLIGFARLLLHRPDWIFLADAADALDAAALARIGQLLQRELGEATIIATGVSGLPDAAFTALLQVNAPPGQSLLAAARAGPVPSPCARHSIDPPSG